MFGRAIQKGVETGACIGFCVAVIQSGGISNFFRYSVEEPRGSYLLFLIGYVVAFAAVGAIAGAVKAVLHKDAKRTKRNCDPSLSSALPDSRSDVKV